MYQLFTWDNMDILSIYKGMFYAVNGICSMTYYPNRPQTIDDSINDFMIVSLPSIILNNEISNDDSYDWNDTTAQFEIYVKDKITTSNPSGSRMDVLSQKLNSLKSKFPIVDKENKFKINRYRIFPPIPDSYGFHYIIVQAHLTTLF